MMDKEGRMSFLMVTCLLFLMNALARMLMTKDKALKSYEKNL